MALTVTGNGKTRTITGIVEHNKIEMTLPNLVIHSDDDGLAKGIAYILQYGFAKTLQDSVSGEAKRLKDRAKQITDAIAAGTEDDLDPEREDGEPLTDAEITAKLQADMVERRDNILDGTVSARGPRLPTIERVMKEIAIANLKAIAKEKGKKMPAKVKGKPNTALDAMVKAYTAANEAKVRAEAERRIEALKNVEVSGDEPDYFAAVA